MPRIPGSVRPLPRAIGTETGPAAPRATESAPATTPARTPAEVYADMAPLNVSPSHTLGTSFAGYSWKAEDLDAVMKQYAVGDAQALVRTAIALQRGDRTLSADELKAAAKKLTSYVTAGHRWSPGVLADIMQQHGLAEETALLRAAKRFDDGNRYLDRDELAAGAKVLKGIVEANDIATVQARLDELGTDPRCTLETLGHIEGQPVRAVHIGPHNGQEPKLRVLVTGGVHGNEPCGTAAAMLLVEQLLKDPRLSEDVAFTVVPLINVRGYRDGTRRTPGDDDLNRHMHLEHQDNDHRPEEVEIVENVLEGRGHELVLDLHSGMASRDGFWLYHRNGIGLAKPALERFGQEFPRLNPASVPNKVMPAPGLVESDPPPPGQAHKGTLKDFAIDHGATWAFTVEAPGSVSYLDQVMGENEIVHQVVLEARLAKYRADVA